MSSGNVYERLFKLGGTIAKLVMDGKRDPEKVADVFQTIVDEKTSTAKTSSRSILRLIQSGLKLSATSGQRLISEAPDIFFPGHIDADFINYDGCNVRGEARPETTVDVHELVENATFKQIFEGRGVPLDQLCLTQDQIIEFVLTHRTHLHPRGYVTLFPFKGKEKFFVARVNWVGVRRLWVGVDHFSYDDVWVADSRFRVVLPQLALKSS